MNAVKWPNESKMVLKRAKREEGDKAIITCCLPQWDGM